MPLYSFSARRPRTPLKCGKFLDHLSRLGLDAVAPWLICFHVFDPSPWPKRPNVWHQQAWYILLTLMIHTWSSMQCLIVSLVILKWILSHLGSVEICVARHRCQQTEHWRGASVGRNYRLVKGLWCRPVAVPRPKDISTREPTTNRLLVSTKEFKKSPFLNSLLLHFYTCAEVPLLGLLTGFRTQRVGWRYWNWRGHTNHCRE